MSIFIISPLHTSPAFFLDAEGKFLPEYIEKEILDISPFQSIDEDGVGGLMQIALERGRKSRHGIEAGICGEHGGDPRSIVFCHNAGLDYVSASPIKNNHS